MTGLAVLLDTPWAWGVAAVLLAAAEIVVPGVFLIWLALAALVTGVAALLFDLPVAADFAIFAVAAVVAIYGGRSLYRRGARPPEPLLNDRAARMVGLRVLVSEPLANGEGRVTVGDGSWLARGPDMAVGDPAIVAAVEDGVLIVVPA